MTDSADPRIALMQKWHSENPELLSQAGLGSSAAFGHGNSDCNFIDAHNNVKKTQLLNVAGIDANAKQPTKDAAHTHDGSAKSKRKRKGKGKKNHSNHEESVLEKAVGGIVKGLIHGLAGGQQQQIHAKTKDHRDSHKNPFVGVHQDKLKTTYVLASHHYHEAVDEAISQINTTLTKFPANVREPFLTVFNALKQYKRVGGTVKESPHTYQATLDKLGLALSAFKAIAPGLSYNLRTPKKIPEDSLVGTASLLSKLINETISTLRIVFKSPEDRTKHGYYELKAQLYKISNSRENFNQVYNALLRSGMPSEDIKQLTSGLPHAVVRPMGASEVAHRAGAGLRDSAEHAFEPHSTISMSNPYNIGSH